jgi:hypothetical protein
MSVPPNTPFRYVVLRHTGIPEPHFDFMISFDRHEKLWTWRIATHPNTWSTHPPQAIRLPDHRRHYLTYEGEISNNRGHVTRISAGTGQVLRSEATLHIQLHHPEHPIILSLPLATDS